MYGANMIPLLGPIAAYEWSRFDRTAPHYDYRISPVESAPVGIGEGAKSLVDVFSDEGDQKDARNIIMGAGYLTGAPGRLIADTSIGTYAWLRGEAGPEAIIYGPPR